MRGMNMLQLVGGVAAAGVVAAGATAFTGSGITPTAAVNKSFIGGSVTQTVNGATIDHVAYSFADGAKTELNQIAITFTDAAADGSAATVTLSTTGGAWTGTSGLTCEAVGHTTTGVVTCSAAAASYFSGGTINSLSITVI
jgi:hypothetical protein